MNTNTSTLLTQVKFTPNSVAFNNGQFSGHLDVTQQVRESFVNNTETDSVVRAENRQLIADMPVGELLVSSVVTANRFESGVEILRLVSMDGDDAAGSLELSLQVTEISDTEISLKVMPLYLSVSPTFADQGHGLDLISGACWLVQDVVAELFATSTAGKTLNLGVSVHQDALGELDEDLINGLSATLAATAAAFKARDEEVQYSEFKAAA